MDMKKHLHFFFRAAALICLWRGAWHLMDLYLFPLNPLYSNIASLLVGAFLLLIADTLFFTPEERETREEKKEDSACAPQE